MDVCDAIPYVSSRKQGGGGFLMGITDDFERINFSCCYKWVHVYTAVPQWFWNHGVYSRSSCRWGGAGSFVHFDVLRFAGRLTVHMIIQIGD